MAANRAVFINGVARRDNGSDASPGKNTNLRLAPAEESGGRLRRLVDLASSLMREAQILARDKAFTDESASVESMDLSNGIDFYGEVQRFETALIKLALEQSEGNQAKAARLLGLRATTLNSKIKLFGIEY
jgi:transcriptional regulator with GAF, ATPase, and Fis domain